MQSIRKELLVEASQEIAFNVFTGKMGLWWPKTHHIGTSPMVDSIVEPKTDGRWYSTHEDGSEVNIGKVLAWDPNGRLVLAWQVTGQFKYDPSIITEVELNFIPEGPTTTRVKFEHRDIDKLTGGEKVIENMDGGWWFILNQYKEVANAA